MAVSAYAAVASLMHVLDNIQHPARHQLRFDRNQIETLREKVSFLQGFLERYSQIFFANREELARQIYDVADEAEDVIDSHVVDQLSHKYADISDLGLSSFYEDTDRVINKIESIKEQLMMVKDQERAIEEPQPTVSVPAAGSPTPHISGKNTIVGFDERLVRIMDELTGNQSDLQILPIVGMGGIGKTTLARNAFDNKCIVDQFDVRLWLTISQEYKVTEILQDLLRGFGIETSESKEHLYKHLFGRKYLIVMDDVWGTEVWDDFKLCFPNNRNGSRILITTRLSNLAASLGSNDPYLMDFLDEEESWNLLCKTTFGHEICPLKLEEIGKCIAKSCKGLPLTIVVIGGLLANSDMTQEFWGSIVERVNVFANSENDEHCSKILSLSYHQLPIHLKPCFLYMKNFPEDCEIRVSQLIKFWVAERFPKPVKGKSLEEVAEGYLKDLIDRNLILIRGLVHGEKIKTCGIHDLLRDFCKRESKKEHFCCAAKVQLAPSWKYKGSCLLCNHELASTTIDVHQVFVASQPTSLVSVSVCDVCRNMYRKPDKLRLVKAVHIQYRQEILQPTKLGYILLPDTRGEFKFVYSSVPLLWNLQTVVSKYGGICPIVLPSKIWEMPQLRHLIVKSAILRDDVFNKKEVIVLKNLQTLSTIINFRCSEEVFKRLPNLKKLGIRYDAYNLVTNWSYYSLHNLVHLQKLESLSMESNPIFMKLMDFPSSLKKLSLTGCRIPWEEMTIIGSLPNLEVLKLLSYAFNGPEWNPIEGEFLRLKFLLITCHCLVHWGAGKEHFPSLERLELEHMGILEELPPGIGEIDSLRSISLLGCCKSLINSAKEILKEQKGFGNESLRLHVKPPAWSTDKVGYSLIHSAHDAIDFEVIGSD